MRTHTRRSTDQWQALIKEQQESLLSAPKFCEQNNVGYASFCQWRKRLSDIPTANSTQQSPTFLAVEPPDNQSDKPQWVVELQLSTDIVLRVGKL